MGECIVVQKNIYDPAELGPAKFSQSPGSEAFAMHRLDRCPPNNLRSSTPAKMDVLSGTQDILGQYP